MLPRLSPFPESAAPPTPLAAAREGRSAPLSSQGAGRQTDSTLTDDASDWRDRFEADLNADVAPTLGEASRRTVERAYQAHGRLGPVAANDTLHSEIQSLAVPLSGGNGVERSASSGDGADRIFQPGADFPPFLSKPRATLEDEDFWHEPPPAFASARMLAIVFLTLVLGLAIITGVALAMLAGWVL